MQSQRIREWMFHDFESFETHDFESFEFFVDTWTRTRVHQHMVQTNLYFLKHVDGNPKVSECVALNKYKAHMPAHMHESDLNKYYSKLTCANDFIYTSGGACMHAACTHAEDDFEDTKISKTRYRRFEDTVSKIRYRRYLTKYDIEDIWPNNEDTKISRDKPNNVRYRRYLTK